MSERNFENISRHCGRCSSNDSERREVGCGIPCSRERKFPIQNLIYARIPAYLDKAEHCFRSHLCCDPPRRILQNPFRVSPRKISSRRRLSKRCVSRLTALFTRAKKLFRKEVCTTQTVMYHRHTDIKWCMKLPTVNTFTMQTCIC
jgi:hypothetical protein